MDIGAMLKTDAGTSEVMQSGMRARNDPANLYEAAAVRFPEPGDTGWNAVFVQDASVIVTTIRVDASGTAQWSSANTFERRNRLDQGSQLRDIVTVCASQDRRDRRALGVGSFFNVSTSFLMMGEYAVEFSVKNAG